VPLLPTLRIASDRVGPGFNALKYAPTGVEVSLAGDPDLPTWRLMATVVFDGFFSHIIRPFLTCFHLTVPFPAIIRKISFGNCGPEKYLVSLLSSEIEDHATD
jgi:hypothetical protein